ncbi:2191_t:CDS:1, partial [Gigaspora margarita]
MNPPSPQLDQFATHYKLVEYICAIYKTQEYAITVKRSCSDLKGEIKNIEL